MTIAKHCIMNLSQREHNAAMRAIKEVRNEPVRNAYFEGYRDGWDARNDLQKGNPFPHDESAWACSHSKRLLEEQVK